LDELALIPREEISETRMARGNKDKVGGNARRERWYGATSEFVFGLLGIRDGIDMHEFIETP
jgi:hypothetical protein